MRADSLPALPVADQHVDLDVDPSGEACDVTHDELHELVAATRAAVRVVQHPDYLSAFDSWPLADPDTQEDQA